MKICFLTSTVFTHGGVARVLTTIANELSKNHEVDIICTKLLKDSEGNIYNLNINKVNIIYKSLNNNFLNKIIKKIITKYNLQNNVLFSILLEKVLYSHKSKKEFSEFLNNKKYDIVIGVHGTFSLFVSMIADDVNAKVYGWQHNSYEAYFNTPNKYYWNQEIIFKKYFINLDANIVLTEHDRIFFNKNISPNTVVIYNPLSFSSLEKSNLKSKKIISVGRLTKQKGFDLLIEAFSIFSNKDSNWKLTIVGDGEEKENLLNLINKLNLGNRIEIISFTREIPSYYLDSSLFILASRWEGFGLVLTEAMECGLPVISFDTSGPREIVQHEKSGFLIERNNIQQLADAMFYLASNQEVLEHFGMNAVSNAKKFKKEKIIMQWNNLLSQ